MAEVIKMEDNGSIRVTKTKEEKLELADQRLIKLKKHKPRLLQRLHYGDKELSGNPYSNVLMDIGNETLREHVGNVILPDYMGAAEFENGVFAKSLGRMYEVGDYDVYKFSMITPIYVVCSAYETERYIIEGIIRNHLISSLQSLSIVRNRPVKKDGDRVWDCSDDINTSAELTKNDYCSFLKTLVKVVESEGAYSGKTVGWMDVDMDYTWFIDQHTAWAFSRIVNWDLLNKDKKEGLLETVEDA